MSFIPEVLKAGSQEDKGEMARIQSFVGAIGIGDLIKTTLGPKGTDKILQSMNTEEHMPTHTTITNDGATILKSLWIDNPAAKILVDVSKQQDQQWGDGTTGVVVLAAELLRAAERLIEQKIHPQVIVAGYHMALQEARKALLEMSNMTENRNDQEKNLKVALTTLSSKLLFHERYHFARLAVDAVQRLKGNTNLDYIQIIKKPGGIISDSYLDSGFILEKTIGAGHPKVLTNCKVIVANTPMDTDKIKIYGSQIKVDSFNAIRDLEEAERDKMKDKVEKIASYGCNVFINRQLIYNYPDQVFKEKKILAIEHADFIGVERLAAALGATVLSTFDDPNPKMLGFCEKIEEILIGEDPVIRITGCQKNEACNIVLRGANQHILDEAERSLHDTLCVLTRLIQSGKVVYGAGAAEMWMAAHVERLATKIDGKKSLAVEAFAYALRQIPAIICNNAGLDAADIVSKLRSEHYAGNASKSIDIENASVGDAFDLGVYEAYESKLSQLCSACQAAEMIIRVDNIIHCPARKREGV